jgi:hypothetical protein
MSTVPIDADTGLGAAEAGEVTAGARTTRSRLMDGLLVVQIVVGFEFFWTVLAKLVRGGFVSGLAADLQDRGQGGAGVVPVVRRRLRGAARHGVRLPHHRR